MFHLAFRVIGSFVVIIACLPVRAAGAPRPLMRDFMGVCGHTVLFKPDLYRPAVGLVRDYHDTAWDLGDDPAFAPQWPFARNRVDWSKVYGSWKKAGYDVDVSLMYQRLGPGKWPDLDRQARAYARSLAAHFGPSSRGLIDSVEIGNEEGSWDDGQYRRLFEATARGLREGDPKLKVATGAVTTGKSHKYAKSVECVRGLEALYDVLTIHTYAELEPWPTWRRSYPEDGRLKYLKDVQALIDWRDRHAPGKGVWITEFGYDASTKPAPKEGTFKQWVGSSEAEQARYLVRSFLLFAAMDVERAYVFFFNDDDEPHVHGSSGLTRKFQPKPAFHAVAHLQATLGAYRFGRALAREEGKVFAFEFVRGDDPGQRIVVAWVPTETQEPRPVTLAVRGKVKRAERMPLKPGPAEPARWRADAAGGSSVTLDLSGEPVYLWVEP